jgi:RNA polymerase sigma-70 factor (ECF subfamily)
VTKARIRSASRVVHRPDDALLRELQRGDLGALGELYDRHAHDVWRAARRLLGNDADVDDVVHAVFIKLPELARSYDGRANAGPWLVGIGVRVALRHRRSTGRFLRMLGRFARTLTVRAPGDPETHSSAREELRAFELAFSTLSPKKQAVFVLVELEGLTTDEAASALEIPAATVRTRLHHARRELHAALHRDRGK